ncbi:hypothetical protein [Bacillus thuringiensis]|uniref:hypothetical protein n=1 Tax=Bacillus thuringiensis TaxID=1428 RepID=UPI000BED38D2|nr:hypothetical protein [Bacillus thuringiensis]PDY26985.1 hypothetical protein COM84_25075 [Bacillus thuringiensis]PGH92611.1 hypothetical protein CN898_26525 [Bacillus thuringiensis]
MNFIKKCIPLALGTACLFSVFSLDSFNIKPVAAAEKKQQPQKYSGEEIFKGVIWGQGKLAKNFADMWDPKTLELMSSKESQESINSLINQLKEQDPEYFIRIEKAVQQKNLKKVDKLLEEGSTALLKIAEKKGELTGDANQGVCGSTVCASDLITYGATFDLGPVVLPNGIVLSNSKIIIQSAPEFLDPNLSKEEIQQKREQNIANIFKRIN